MEAFREKKIVLEQMGNDASLKVCRDEIRQITVAVFEMGRWQAAAFPD